MMAEFHFLRPWWLAGLLPLLGLLVALWRQRPQLEAWSAVCDKHLLAALVQFKGQGKRHWALLFLFLAASSMLLGLAGPAWERLPVPAYQPMQPRVLVLDLSDAMLMKDLQPDRLSRAKFKLHDLFQHRDVGQFGLVVYAGEPFVASPLTDDAQTIDALLSSLTPDVMPVGGQRLDTALEEAGKLISNAGFAQGQILVLTGNAPGQAAIEAAKLLAEQQISTSIMPILAEKALNPSFQQFADAGRGTLVPLSDKSTDLEQWLENSRNRQQFSLSSQKDIPLWRDEGRWFVLPGLLFLLPVFRRGWLERLST